MRKEVREVWIATDGTEFTTEAECSDYEVSLGFNEMLRQNFYNANRDEHGIFSYAEFKQCLLRNQEVVASLLNGTGHWKCEPERVDAAGDSVKKDVVSTVIVGGCAQQHRRFFAIARELKKLGIEVPTAGAESDKTEFLVLSKGDVSVKLEALYNTGDGAWLDCRQVIVES